MVMSKSPPTVDQSQFERFASRPYYLHFDVLDLSSWSPLSELLTGREDKIRAIYLATPPALFGPVAQDRANFVALNTGNIQTLHPFACTVLGMGEDGHFASLFPDSPELEEGLSSETETVKVTTPSSAYNRTSATLNTICDSDLIILLIFGNVKKNIVEAPAGYPINHVLSQEQTPVRIIWAPT
jgi:hypothetical protein